MWGSTAGKCANSGIDKDLNILSEMYTFQLVTYCCTVPSSIAIELLVWVQVLNWSNAAFRHLVVFSSVCLIFKRISIYLVFQSLYVFITLQVYHVFENRIIRTVCSLNSKIFLLSVRTEFGIVVSELSSRQAHHFLFEVLIPLLDCDHSSSYGQTVQCRASHSILVINFSFWHSTFEIFEIKHTRKLEKLIVEEIYENGSEDEKKISRGFKELGHYFSKWIITDDTKDVLEARMCFSMLFSCTAG